MAKHAHNFIDLTGNTYGRLVVINFSHKDGRGKTFWSCKCKCGNTKDVYSDKLKTGHTMSCGCIRRELIRTHNESKTRFYRIWHSAKSRCGREKNYISVSFSKAWIKYEKFKEDMYDEYIKHVNVYGEKNTTIDRINNNGDYCKENCRWATIKEQNNNMNKTRFIIHDGVKESLSNIYDKYKLDITKAAFINRMVNLKWSLDEVLNGIRKPWSRNNK